MSLHLGSRPWLCCLLAVGLLTAEPMPKAPTPEQQARLLERDRLATEARKLGQAGKTAEMIAAWQKKIAIERAVFGDVHEQVAQFHFCRFMQLFQGGPPCWNDG